MRISIINGICVTGDAISESVRGMQEAFEQLLKAECVVFTYACELAGMKHKIVSDVSDILFDPFFMESDLIVYHFGIYYGLFDAILVGNGKAKQVVYYHNITPKEFVALSAHRTIERSLRQRANIASADAVWAVSAFNKDDLVEYGVNADLITINPLYSRFTATDVAPVKSRDKIEVLYVGRFVSSKGVIELIKAFDRAKKATGLAMRLTMIGNVDFSDQAYLAQMRRTICDLALDDDVEFKGKVDDDTLAGCYARSHIFAIATYHEGFCVPIVEAMRAQCVPVAYGAGNVASLIGAHGVVVATGDWEGLGDALARTASFFDARDGAESTGQPVAWSNVEMSLAEYQAATAAYVETFSYARFAERTAQAALEVLSAPSSPPHLAPSSMPSRETSATAARGTAPPQ